MKISFGSENTPLLEIYNPIRNLWSVRWGKKELEDGFYSFFEEIIDHKPTLEEIKNLIYELISEEIREKIYSGFKYEGNTVYLSVENQLNYRNAYDFETIPVTFKFGETFKTFTDKDLLFNFYNSIQKHINDVLLEGYEKKQNLSLEEYVSILSKS